MEKARTDRRCADSNGSNGSKKSAVFAGAKEQEMRGKVYLLALFLIIGGILLPIGCGTARRGEPLAGEMKIASEQVKSGQQVFMHNCYQCHPGGEAGLGPALNNKPLPGFLMKLQVRKGLGAMPGFSEDHISAEDLNSLVAYLKTLRRLGGN